MSNPTKHNDPEKQDLIDYLSTADGKKNAKLNDEQVASLGLPAGQYYIAADGSDLVVVGEVDVVPANAATYRIGMTHNRVGFSRRAADDDDDVTGDIAWIPPNDDDVTGAWNPPKASITMSLADLRRVWETLSEDVRSTVSKPGDRLADGWRHRPRNRDWDNRQIVNVPQPWTDTKARRPDDDDAQAHLPFDFALPPLPVDEPRFVVGYLPTLEPADTRLPTALMDLFGKVASPGYGGPVPLLARIGWEVLVALSDEDRGAGPALLNIMLADLHQMVYPQTKGWRATTGRRLVNSIRDLDKRRLRWRGDARGGTYPMVEVYRLPSVVAKDEAVTFLSHIPPGGNQGPQVDKLLLRKLAAKSWRLHRVMLAAYMLIDQYGTVKGRLIDPTLPVVRREKGTGYVLDAKGRLVTETKGRHKGQVTRRATHPLAVQTGERERNPEADRYPWLEGDDLILLANGRVADTPEARRNQRRRTIEAVRELAAAGDLDYQKQHHKVRGGAELEAIQLLPSPAHLAAHRARWAARRHDRRGDD